MKTFIASTLTAAFLASSAIAGGATRPLEYPQVVPAMSFANPVSVGVYAEYAVHAQAIEFGADIAYRVDNFTLFAETVISGPTTALAFNRSALGVSYSLAPNAAVYTQINFDGSFNYRDVVIGIAARF